MTSFLLFLRLAKDLARTLRLGTKGFFDGGVTKHITTHPNLYTVVENHPKMSHFLKSEHFVYICCAFVYFYGNNVSCLFTLGTSFAMLKN